MSAGTAAGSTSLKEPPKDFRIGSDFPFYLCFGILGSVYVFLIAAMLIAEATYTTPGHILNVLNSPEIRYSIRLSLLSCGITTILSLWVAVPIGYMMSRFDFRGKYIIDAVLDIPIVLPPLVIGLCLLILFQVELYNGMTLEEMINRATLYLWNRELGVTYEIPAVILSQFMVASAFAVRTMRITFDQINPRYEQVALTLGCRRSQAFWQIVFPQSYRGLVAAGTLAWARSLGEFGPILIFAGATRFKTEVLPTTVFLELTVGNVEGAVAASLIMVIAAVVVLIIARYCGLSRSAL